jgi:DNA-binding transcriptional ArsR family regulator
MNDAHGKTEPVPVGGTEIFQLSDTFKLLGDPTRLRVIDLLSRGEISVKEIADNLGMTQSAISHQLRLLRNMRMVKFHKDKRSVIYSLDDEHVLGLFMQALEHIRHE